MATVIFTWLLFHRSGVFFSHQLPPPLLSFLYSPRGLTSLFVIWICKVVLWDIAIYPFISQSVCEPLKIAKKVHGLYSVCFPVCGKAIKDAIGLSSKRNSSWRKKKFYVLVNESSITHKRTIFQFCDGLTKQM